ncbi:MAG TPA: alanine racemase [Kineosporiaceae bacterium]
MIPVSAALADVPARGLPGRPGGLPAGLPAGALVDLDAIAENVAVLRQAARGAALMAVVKADGYGHGIIPAARAALRGGADWLGVAQLAEALQVRAAGITAPVLAWLTVPGDRFTEAVAAGVDVGVSASWTVTEVAAAARATGIPARVHLKVDTGLGRGGCPVADLPDLLAGLLRHQAEGTVRLVGLFSHLACADTPGHPSVAGQVAAFAAAVALAERAGARPELRHLANSAATLAVPPARFDLVRPGIAVYGLSPIPDLATSAQLALRPAMSLLGRVAMVKDVPAGQGVSYGLTHVTAGDTRLALVPLGYGDGLPRHASGAGPVLLAGRRVPIAGRVCMDQVVLDLGGRDVDVRAGDVAVLFGPGRDGEPTAQDWADAAGTISYEIVTRIGGRVPRHYLGTASGGGIDG